jgi:hypothetical protein
VQEVEDQMSFQMPITISSVVEGIDRRRYLLPAIQREFVWKPDQIEQLFDSIMRGYPIGSLLFWDVEPEWQARYQFYEFVRDYHEKSARHNPKANLAGVHGLTAVLDGQQRLTSLYIGLKGSYAYRTKYTWAHLDANFPVRKLYLDLLEADMDWDGGYSFKFMTTKERDKHPDRWFEVGQILNFEGLRDINGYLQARPDLAASKFASDTLMDLFQRVRVDHSMNFFLEKDQDLDKVLHIFIRVNSGGTQLSYSDLLLSVAVAQWKRLDAREEITRLVDDLNDIGAGFRFDRDFVLKACLALTDLPSVVFKVTNFTANNMERIEDAWATVEANLRSAVALVASFGFSASTLTSLNSVIPIAYYLMKRGHGPGWVDAASGERERESIRRWHMAALLKGTFGDQADTVLTTIRAAIADTTGAFPVDEINTRLLLIGKSVRFELAEVDALLDAKYGQRQAFQVLSMLYGYVDYRNVFHQDHVHPKSRFTIKRLIDVGFDEAEARWMADRVNDLANLQMLGGPQNLDKGAQPFADWLATAYPDAAARSAYLDRQYIPRDVGVDLGSFKDFFVARRTLMRDALARTLGTNPVSPPDMGTELPVVDEAIVEAVAHAGGPSVWVVPEGASEQPVIAEPRPSAADGTTPHGVASDPRSALAAALREAVIEVARGPGENVTTYTDLARRLGLELGDDAQRHMLTVLLGELSRAEVAAGRPMLSSIVVQYEGGTPGSGFFGLGRELGLIRDGEDADLFAFRQMRATWNHWQGGAPRGAGFEGTSRATRA